jgi:hypothetical protein
VLVSDINPIYDIENHSQLLPSQLPQQITFDFEQWQQGDDVFTDAPQTPKDDLAPCPPDIFRSYLEAFDEYSPEHLDSFHEKDYQPPLCSGLDRSEGIVCLKKDSHDSFFQPPPIILLCCVSRGVAGRYVFYIEFPKGRALESKGWLNTKSLSLSSQFFNFPLRIFQSSATSLSIPSQASEYEDVLGSQFADLLSQYSEPWTFHDSFLKWIECFPQKLTGHDFFPPTHLHELDLTTSIDTMHFLTHGVVVLNLSLFWLMMKHKGRYRGTLLDWLYWLFDYTQHPTNR